LKKILILLVLIFPISSHALDCIGQVKEVLDWPEQCDGKVAFLLDNSNGKYICTISDKGEAMVLAAVVSGKHVGVRLTSNDTSCEAIASHYLSPLYMSLKDY
jgi:hypothetical protein